MQALKVKTCNCWKAEGLPQAAGRGPEMHPAAVLSLSIPSPRLWSEGSEALLPQSAGSVPVRGIPNTVIAFNSGKAPGTPQESGSVPAFVCTCVSEWGSDWQ